MKVHHLNCATMCPFLGGKLGYQGHSKLVCHVLLVESNEGLILVDTGLGLADLASPRERLGAGFVLSSRPSLDPREAAVNQVRRLGFDPAEVRHIVVTHLDLDHAGGLSDFPNARCHVLMAEHEAAVLRSSLLEKQRYRTEHVDLFPRWSLYQEKGERWMGFSAVSALAGLSDDILLIPLIGHTRGHCGVAVRGEQGWLLHAGDAYFHHDEKLGKQAPWPMELFQRGLAMDGAARLANRARVAELQRGGAVKIFCAHDPIEFTELGGQL